MKGTQNQPQELCLLELLQALETRTNTAAISADERQQVIQVVMKILEECTEAMVRPWPGLDMQEVRGQWHVKRALEVAAAGGHNLLLVGPAGAGKALLARTLYSLLPVTSLAYPFREPPSSISKQAFVGEVTRPGELTRAHGGVLFLKDLDTFDLSLLAELAQAVERHTVTFPLEDSSVLLPAKFILVGTVKPCPCGFAGDPERLCRCAVEEIAQYRQNLKEVVRICFAIETEVPLIGEDILSQRPDENSATIRRRVETARNIQSGRYTQMTHIQVNADLRSADEMQRYCPMVSTGHDLLKTALRQLQLTPLEVLRVQAVARTIADLDGSAVIAGKHLAEAIRYLSGFIRDE